MNLNCAKFIKKTGYNSEYYTPFSNIYSPGLKVRNAEKKQLHHRNILIGQSG